MLNVQELERRWLRYKIRTYLPYAITMSVLLCLLIILYAVGIFDTDETEEKKTPTAPHASLAVPNPATTGELTTSSVAISSSGNTAALSVQPSTMPATPATGVTSQNVLKTDQPKPVVPEAVSPTRKSESVLLKPSMGFLDTLTESVQSEKVVRETPEVPAPLTQITNVNTHKTAEPVASAQTQENIEIDRTITSEDIHSATQRFSTTKSPALGLYLARYYYSIGAYDKSYHYALQINSLDSRNEESWLLFAKSQVKLGQRNQAEKTLRSYIRSSGSSEAKLLLDSIMQGRFK